MHKGIDVSNFQGDPDFAKVARADYDFVYVKRSEGADTLDPGALNRRFDAMRADLHTGFYHFLHPRPGRSGKVEAEWFFKHVEGVKGGDGAQRLLRLVLDIEVTHFTGGDRIQQTLDYSYAALDRLRDLAGHTPVVYTFPSFIERWGDRFSDFPLWIAHPGVSRPTLPGPWRDWAVWQNSFQGRVPGVSGDVDTDACPVLNDLILNRANY